MQVKIIERQKQATLVEWIDALGPHRSIIPADKVGASENVDGHELDLGIPYGVPWEMILTLTVTSHMIARLLRESGIWTEEDMRRNINAVRAVFTEAYSIDLKNLIDSVRQAREGGTP